MKDEFNIILTILAGTLFMLGMVLFIVLFVVLYKRRMQKREMEHEMAIKDKELEVLNAAIRTQETEREKFSRDLHDEIGPLMSSIKMNITKNQMILKKGELSIADLQEGREMVDHALESVRNISHGLSPRFVKEFGLSAALEGYLKEIEGVELCFNSTLENGVRYSENVELNMYRIALELLHNIRKHEMVTWINVDLSQEEEALLLKITHDGMGITNEEIEEKLKSAKGIGLESLRSRVNSIHGNIDYKKGSPSIITVTATINENE